MCNNSFIYLYFPLRGVPQQGLSLSIVTTFFWSKDKIAVQALRSSRRSREATNQINNSDVSDISEQPAA
ncbi:hypothetical protein TIFTF001_002436 [Ficus carica]|uniref:Uncharacterized protein n=1 Tax=Ficus carica TaxID=3494 RepID=A0AA87ZMR7_FICCA|nr:hypothetical protein TIFTF001_002436 [Ficus carica]